MRILMTVLLGASLLGVAHAEDLTGGLPLPQTAAHADLDAPRKVVGLDLRHVKEDPFVQAAKGPVLLGVAAVASDFHPEREPLILVHGIDTDFENLQPIVDRFAHDSRFQIYVLAYSDMHRRTSQNGDGFAKELCFLSDELGEGRDITIVAHSMGGLVTRRALDQLSSFPEHDIERFGRVRFIAVDTPWHGFAGPSDRGFEGFEMKLARAFMPDGLEDMRGKSDMFQGDPHGKDEASRAGMFGVKLAPNIQTTLVFAQQGKAASDWTEKPLTDLPSKLVAFYAHGDEVKGDARLENFWKALHASRTFGTLDATLRAEAAAGTLDESAVKAALEASFPRFPGDHTSVLTEHPGERSFLDYLSELLGG